MKVLAVDDEKLMLTRLVDALEASNDIKEVNGFNSCLKAAEFVKEHKIDAAFLDIHMRGMTGLELAEIIKEEQPHCKIVFCTGFDEHAIEAFKLHAIGYLMKPISNDAVQKEIDYIKELIGKDKLLQVKCFGNFEVFADGKPLSFKRTKTKELLAYLIDRNGSSVNSKQICSVLWEDDTDDEKNLKYTWQLLGDLRLALKNANAEDVLVKTGNNYSVNPDLIDCDYYSYLEDGEPNFMGEYMTQYSWAEETCATLWDI